jgi:hypothetical protein
MSLSGIALPAPNGEGPFPEMNAQDAVDILNRHSHNDCSCWGDSGSDRITSGDFCKSLTYFEAIAIAEKYLRDAKVLIEKFGI